jgi:hypothetical protein
MRIEAEKKIVGRLVSDVLAEGRAISVSYERGYDIEEMYEYKRIGCTDHAKIMEDAFAVDICHLFIHIKGQTKFTQDGSINCAGWVFLISGNGVDIISDYSSILDNLGLMSGAFEVVKEYS